MHKIISGLHGLLKKNLLELLIFPIFSFLTLTIIPSPDKWFIFKLGSVIPEIRIILKIYEYL